MFERAGIGPCFLRSDGIIAMPDLLLTPDRPTPHPHFRLISTSPDGNQLAFSGMKGGLSDLYLFDLRTDAYATHVTEAW